MKRENLQRLLRPRYIAFIGGDSSAPGIKGTITGGFDGPVWSVNPKREKRIAGLACYPSVANLPQPPDASFIWAPREATIEIVRELAEIGAGGAVCYAAGFAETEDGADFQDQLIAAAGDFAVLGPNCYGFVNFVDRAGVWPSEFLNATPERGPALVAQSGNITINMMYNQRSVPFSYVISSGNEAVIDSSDIMQVLLDDERVTAIGLYIEGIRNIAEFSKAAERALRQGIPIVVLKAGRSEAARRSAMTHTGSLSGADDAYEALFERFAITRARSPEMLMEQLKALSVTGPLAGNRFAVMTCSGGEAAMVSDYAEACGIALPQPTPKQHETLRAVLPDFAQIVNPLDYNTSIWGDREALERAFTAMMSENCDCAMLVLDFHQGSDYYDAPNLAIDALIAASEATGVPAMHACSLSESVTAAAQGRMIAAGVSPLQGLEHAIMAAGACVRYGAHKSANQEVDISLPPLVTAPEDAPMLDEHASKQLMAAYGLTIPEGRVADADGASSAADEVGFPVVIKALDAALVHKSEFGGVRLGLTDAEAVSRAASEMTIGIGVERFLVESMVDDVVCELIIGVKHDPTLGLVLVIGSGGVLVEILDDSHIILLPTDHATVAQTLDRLRAAAQIAGFRGKRAGDREAVISAVLAVAQFAADHRGRLVELDINPLVVLPQGQGAVAVDAAIRIAEE
ncbi:MAG: acetate--CoA ligase family protein [Alphaproteobacteria bacterium]|mgnify:CR=1 FL=1